MLSVFKRNNKKLFKVFPTPEQYQFTDAIDGVNMTVPVVVFNGNDKHLSRVVINIGSHDIYQLAKKMDMVTHQEASELFNVSAKRAKLCRNGHRQISVNVVHWPNGTEDCRLCYLEWEAKQDAKKGTPS